MFKKNQTISYVLLIIAFTAIIYSEKKQLDSHLNQIDQVDKNEETSTVSKDDIKNSNEQNNQSAETLKNENTASPQLQKISTWTQQESLTLNDTTQNQQNKLADYKKLASELTADEIVYLKTKSTEVKATANERILSTYLLTLGLSETTNALAEIAKANLSLASQQPAHSLGETQVMHEKTIRIMAIDELFNRANANPTLRDQYMQMAQQIQNEELQKYALKRAAEFKK